MFQVQCSGPVTGLCQVPHTGVLWVAAGSSVNYYEPKSGECVSANIYCLWYPDGLRFYQHFSLAYSLRSLNCHTNIYYIPPDSHMHIHAWRCTYMYSGVQ